MPPTRRALLAALATPALPARAQPALTGRPLRLVVPFAVGGLTDVVARILADALAPRLSRPLVVDNLGGAGSTLGAAAAARAAPDGNTLLLASVGHCVMPALYPAFPFDPERDFTPVALLVRQPFVVAVHPQVPAPDLPTLLTWLRTRHGEANFGTAGIGATSHLAGELLKSLAGVDFTTVIYRGTPQAVTDLVAGRIDLMIDSQTLLAPFMAERTLRGLAVTTPEPSALLPQLPPIAATVPGYDSSAWQALYAPAHTPPEVVAPLAAACAAALADPAVLRRLTEAGCEPFPDHSPAALATYLHAEVAKWLPILRATGARAG